MTTVGVNELKRMLAICRGFHEFHVNFFHRIALMITCIIWTFHYPTPQRHILFEDGTKKYRNEFEENLSTTPWNLLQIGVYSVTTLGQT